MSESIQRDAGPAGEPLRPDALRVGDTIGIVAPASAFDRVAFEAGCARLRTMGYVPFFDDSIFEKDIYFAGSAERRAREIMEMFARPEVKAILCARGGYGCNYLLKHLDISIILRYPKIFLGYSDVTTLLTWFSDNGLMTFHGPMVASDFSQADSVDLASWSAALSGEPFEVESTSTAGMKTLVEGNASGQLYGGCLSIIAASLGTPYEVQTRGKILFLEDVGAKPYQIDRMLMQLKLAGKLDGLRGLVFGEMKDCVQPGGQNYTLEEVIMRMVGGLGVPVIYGVPSGHVTGKNVTLPVGGEVTLEARRDGASLCVAVAVNP